jgi:hypothetical protein
MLPPDFEIALDGDGFVVGPGLSIDFGNQRARWGALRATIFSAKGNAVDTVEIFK